MHNFSMGKVVANNKNRELWKEVKNISGTNNKLPNTHKEYPVIRK